jgi:TatD DNase family protein
MLIDTHAHIGFDAYDEDRDEMMQRAYETGVHKVLHPCCTLAEFSKLIELTEFYNGEAKVNLFAAVGVHPCNIETWNDTSKAFIDEQAQKYKDQKLKAIGETGLDYFHCTDPTEQEKQRNIFQDHIDIAKKHSLPLIVHTRDAWEDTQKILKANYKLDPNANNGAIHCFTGSQEDANNLLELGFYISWSGVITYKKNDHFRETAKTISLKRFLVETDSPYLAPQAKRGKRNEPSYVNFVVDTLSECYQLQREELVKQSTKNAQTLFSF